MSTVAELRVFANMRERTSCPRCQGYGFFHSSIEKHDKPTGQRCRRCDACVACDGSGIVVGKVGCQACSTRGFIHPESAVRFHPKQINARCIECVDCKECYGKGVLTKEQLMKQKQTPAQPTSNANKRTSFLATTNITSPIDPSVPIEATKKENMEFELPPILPLLPENYFFYPSNDKKKKNKKLDKFLPTTVDAVHPHMMNPSIQAALSAILEKMPVIMHEEEDKPKKSYEKALTCPKCEGLGFLHSSPSKHDKPSGTKCKGCTPCDGCQGSGKVVAKIACTDCSMKGFIHTSTEREHDAPTNLRCFFCIDCKVCKGRGLIDILAATTLHNEKQKQHKEKTGKRKEKIVIPDE